MSISCLSNDEAMEAAAYLRDVKPDMALMAEGMSYALSSPEQTKREESEVTSTESSSDNESSPVSALPRSFKPLCRQFWSSGEYATGQEQCQSVPQGGQNRLRVHPKFLHSNATSHKWAFGAVAELLDNAVDEIQHGATFVLIDKITNPRDGSHALLIQDDGGGMDPEMLRCCMSFGFSDKHQSSIGQYGNGFKTSTMRLGADVIVFSRCGSTLTQSVGLLSYTFLTQTGHDDIVVPMVDYRFNPHTGAIERLLRHGQKEFSANLTTILKWSPFATESELINFFSCIGNHGTKLVVYNLWYNDDGDMELDFESDPKDILINGATKSTEKTNSNVKLLHQNHTANRLRYSLRVYSSILYLHRPESFKIILRGQEVERHYLVKELKYCECVLYKPQVGGRKQAEVITTIGYLKEAPNVSIHGFNIYHKNRLILPFTSVVSPASSKGRGVSGVLEANFIKPTHDKQGFERSTLYQKLETRLKEMTNEYWDTHCDLVGYCNQKKPVPSSLPPIPFAPQMEMQAPISTPSCSSGYDASSQAGKRRRENEIAMMQPSKRQVLTGVAAASGFRNNPRSELGHDVGQRQLQSASVICETNRNLRAECLQKEKTEKELELKEQKLRDELEEVQRLMNSLLIELISMDVKCKVEKQ
ncbi:protein MICRORCHIDIA 6-like [Iris pallida]|uniref:Protein MICRORCHIDIA 6-like n=1 Tax=Iris pallida TaxID=29817 RepID=A0AAX6IJ96_IRIPA|nr:protein MICRORCHIDIA 6-like [Iris pallida]